MSNIPILLDNSISIPSDHELASRARSELQYTVFDRGIPVGMRLLYHETEKYLHVPRHYIDPTTIPWESRKSYDFPVLNSRCFIEPWNQDQADAFEFLKKYSEVPGVSDAIISLRCGEGKSYIGLKAAFDYGYHTLVIAHTKSILDGWSEKIMELTNAPEIGFIGEGVYNPKPLTLALVQTLYRMPPEKLQDLDDQYGTIVFDECHHISAPEFSLIGNAFRGRRIGLSATTNREDGLSFITNYALGNKVFHRVSYRKKAAVFVHKVQSRDLAQLTNYAKSTSSLADSNTYLTYLEGEIRSKFKEGRKILILSARNELTNNLSDRISDLHVGVNIGNTKKEERISNLKTKPVVFCEMSIGKEGLDEKTIDTVMVITPIKDKNAVVQIAGRAEREGPKLPPQVHFYVSTHDQRMSTTAEKAKRALVNAGYSFSEEVI